MKFSIIVDCSKSMLIRFSTINFLSRSQFVTLSTLNKYIIFSLYCLLRVDKYTYSTQVKYAYLVKNKGLIQFEQVNGTIWTLATINQNDSVSVESFDYSEDSCY